MTKKPSSLHVRYLILGGGLTGLSTAYHLEQQKQTDYLVVEKNSFFGGLCASEVKNGFTFDYSGHLLHLHNPYTKQLVRRLLKGNLLRHKRNAFINLYGRKIPFPFQANLWALPAKYRRACVEGALQAAKQPIQSPKNFEQWAQQSFGRNMYECFFKPYNQKLWQTPLTELTCDWCGTFVPTPNITQIKQGARRPGKKSWGYNSYFYYPKSGGCAALADALAERVPNTWLSAEVTSINLANQRALVQGKWVSYDTLINTLPLPVFLQRCVRLPKHIKQKASKLKSTSVYVFQIAIGRKITPFHWIYFPEPEMPFYRVGMQSAFSPYNAPKGTSSLYIETTQKITPGKATEQAIFKTLCQKGIIKEQDKILFSFWRTLNPAYAIYDKYRLDAVTTITRWLQQQHTLCAGRYGCWEYSFMERSLLQGKEIASILGIQA
ncbi:MAG: FAD-dependent oxidoreductase [Elusimicrobiaceae bacterium]|nr:FAD-dependent oxidoreductase [Elusimicrobiaceae bacterium]